METILRAIDWLLDEELKDGDMPKLINQGEKTMLQAYKNDPQLKKNFIKEIKWHAKQDAIIQGTYGDVEDGAWKGCAVACSLRSLDKMQGKEFADAYQEHERYEPELGIPEWLARLEDTLFEGLPKDDAMKWPLQFAQAIPVGANLEPVKWKFSAYLMKENIDRVLSLDISDDLKEQVVSAIRQVLRVHETAIKTGKWDESAARSAESAAESAAWSAESAAESAAWSAESARAAESSAWSAWSARSAAWSAWSAWSAARSARSAWSAARSAESAAESAARSAESAAESAARAAESSAYVKHANKLLALLRAAK